MRNIIAITTLFSADRHVREFSDITRILTAGGPLDRTHNLRDLGVPLWASRAATSRLAPVVLAVSCFPILGIAGDLHPARHQQTAGMKPDDQAPSYPTRERRPAT